MKGRTRLIFFGVVALQLLFILGLVAYKEVTLRFGSEVVLQTVPVDPRDLFRGDYVTLRYEVSTLRYPDVYLHYWETWNTGDQVYVRLEPTTLSYGQEVWRAVEASRNAGSEGDLFIKGRVTRVNGAYLETVLRVEYGIESYFVPEGQGLDIQRARDVKVTVAVNGFGEGIIKGLIVDGQPWQPR